jgi:chromosomal replication initiator protein
MYLLRIDFNLQFMRIADILGRGDHTTVMHGVDKIKKNVENDTSLRELIEDIRTRLWT